MRFSGPTHQFTMAAYHVFGPVFDTAANADAFTRAWNAFNQAISAPLEDANPSFQALLPIFDHCCPVN